MKENKALAIGATAVIVVLLLGTLYVAFGPGRVDPANGTTQTGATVYVGDANDTARIVVSGSGTISYVPDEAIVSAGVTTQDATVTAAVATNTATMNSVIKALNAIGVTNDSMQTTGYSIAPDYNYNSNNGVQTITGYTVSNTLNVNVTATNCSSCAATTLGQRAAQVIGVVTQAGANQVSFGFALSNQLATQLQNQALQQAVVNAHTQAATIAGAAGVTITGVISINDVSVSIPPITNGLAIQGAVTSSPSSSPSILPGTSTFGASVEVVYAIS